MKFGNSVLALPLRNPTVLAKEIATIDFISGGRMLPAVGLGTDNPAEFEACGVNISERAGRTDEAIVLIRRLWTEDSVTFHGKYFNVTQVHLEPRTIMKPCPPIWIGGRTDAALRRTGRLGDGWLASTVTPAEVGAGIIAIRRYAAEANRSVPDDHYGVIIPYCFDESHEKALGRASGFILPARTDLGPEEYGAFGNSGDILRRVNAYIDVGATKFVMRAVCSPEETLAQTERLAREVIPLLHKNQ
jgi:probable F420-dependent oxidoreductase